MYNMPRQYPFMFNPQMYNMLPYMFWYAPQMMYPPMFPNMPIYNQKSNRPIPTLKDYGSNPFVIDIENASEVNNNFRTALWTGNNLQVTLMSIGVGDDIGLEVHTSGDQFIRIEEGDALVKMGDSQDNLDFQKIASDGYAIMIPAGKWHDIVNLGNKPLKLYVIYAPPQHPQGTVHNTKKDAEAAEFNRIY